LPSGLSTSALKKIKEDIKEDSMLAAVSLGSTMGEMA
jgi:hypothetical protein